MTKRKTTVTRVAKCSDDYAVITTHSEGAKTHTVRNKPCEQCPWRKDVPTGVFPAQAYRESAPTSYDMAQSTFACHMSGRDKPATCAGFLLRHAHNNLSVRLSECSGRINLSRLNDGGYPIYETYREMAIANGVDSEDPCLAQVRGNEDRYERGVNEVKKGRNKD